MRGLCGGCDYYCGLLEARDAEFSEEKGKHTSLVNSLYHMIDSLRSQKEKAEAELAEAKKTMQEMEADCEMYEAMKEGVQVRIADLEAERDQYRTLYHSGPRCQCSDDEACAHVRRAEKAEAEISDASDKIRHQRMEIKDLEAELAEERKYNGTKEDIRTLVSVLEHRNAEVERLRELLRIAHKWMIHPERATRMYPHESEAEMREVLALKGDRDAKPRSEVYEKTYTGGTRGMIKKEEP